jgi:hypothetical protein
MPRDEQFESRVSTYREKQRLLVVKSLPFRASIADIKKACREKLTKPETARFFWSQPEDSKNKHPGWCMVGFDFRGDFRQAQQDLQGLEIRGRPIRMEKAKRVCLLLLFSYSSFHC